MSYTTGLIGKGNSVGLGKLKNEKNENWNSNASSAY